jgi:hypothetical protein
MLYAQADETVKEAVSAEPEYVFYEGQIMFINAELGEMTLSIEEDGEETGRLIKIKEMDPDEVYVSNGQQPLLELKHLERGDLIELEGRIIDEKLIVEDIWTHNIKPGVEDI